jgi:hypothetical protein
MTIMNNTKSSLQVPDKNVDKMGYMSVMVGDSAALLSSHLQEYGRHYGMAAYHLGQVLQDNNTNNDDGVAAILLTTARRVLTKVESVMIPWLTVASSWHLVVTTVSALATWHHTRNTQHFLTMAWQQQVTTRHAEHLLQCTTPHAIAALLRTAHLYAHDESKSKAEEGGNRNSITDIHVVVSDSYQASQIRIELLYNNDNVSFINDNIHNNNNTIKVRVFESLQEAFDAASSSSSSQEEDHHPTDDTHHDATAIDRNNNNNNHKRVLIYVATLQPLYYGNHHQYHRNPNNKNNKDNTKPRVLRIQNCHDFVLRAEVGQETGPRLLLDFGSWSLDETSHGTFHGVALVLGGRRDFLVLQQQQTKDTSNNNNNRQNPIQFVRCTTIPAIIDMSLSATTVVPGFGRNKSGLVLAGSIMVATVVATLFQYTFHCKNDSTANRKTTI